MEPCLWIAALAQRKINKKRLQYFSWLLHGIQSSYVYVYKNLYEPHLKQIKKVYLTQQFEKI